MKSKTLLNVVLPMLNVPNIDTAQIVIDTVYQNNEKSDLNDLSFFKECASLVISELKY